MQVNELGSYAELNILLRRLSIKYQVLFAPLGFEKLKVVDFFHKAYPIQYLFGFDEHVLFRKMTTSERRAYSRAELAVFDEIYLTCKQEMAKQ